MGVLHDYVLERERLRDEATNAAALASPRARRALRVSAWSRGLMVLATAGAVVILGVGPALDHTSVRLALIACLVTVVVALAVSMGAAMVLARAERDVAPVSED